MSMVAGRCKADSVRPGDEEDRAMSKRALMRTPKTLLRQMASLLLTLTLLLPNLAGGAPVSASQSAGETPAAGAARSDATSTWDSFQPADWVATTAPACSVHVSDSLGLQPVAQYAYSIDGGATWSDWTNSGLSLSSAISTSAFITVTGATFVQSATANRIQFRILDAPGATDTSPIYTVKVDTQAPAAPISASANPITWTNQNAFTVTWSNPVDLSGIAGAYHKLDSAPTHNADGELVLGADLNALTNLSVTGSGAHPLYLWLRDNAGNANYQQRATVTFYYDNIAPTEPMNLMATPAGWSSTNSFNLNWTNPADTSGIAGAYYKLDSVPTAPTDGTFVAGAGIHSISGISVSGDGVHTAYIWLQDSAGNVDHTRRSQVTLSYDHTAPTLPASFASATHSVGVWSANNVIEAHWSAASDATSGIAGYALRWDQVPNTLPAPITTTTALSATSPALADGSGYYAHLRAVDNAGNWTLAALHLGPFSIDRTPPTAPISLTASPGAWTSQNAFTVTWSNPTDLSGVAGAYYKFDAPPANATDGNLVLGDGLAALTNLSVSGDGAHPIYVWLRDKAGNVDHTQRSVATLYLGTAPAGAPINLVAIPDTWTNTNSFTLQWTNPSTPSGISGAYYKLDAVPTAPGDGTFVAGVDITSISGVTVIGDGIHTVYVWLRNGSGIADHNQRAQATLRYDSTPPVPSSAFSSPSHQVATWSNDPTVDVQWTAAADAFSGTAGYALSWDQNPSGLPAPITTTIGLTGTSPILPDGSSHYAHLRARDAAGNWTPTALNLGPFYIDTQPPSAPISMAATPITWTNSNAFTVTWTNPSDLSGIAGAYYKFDAAPTSNADGSWVAGANLTALTNLSVAGDGTHVIYVWLKDNAGGVDYTRYATATFYYQGTPPAAPISLSVMPDGWTNVNSFGLTWTNPPDLSGIIGAYYKLDAPPTTPTDGVYVAGANIQSLSGLTVSGDGDHAIYVWLKDRAGNVDANNRAQAALRFDGTPPSSPTLFTSPTHFIATWSNVGQIETHWSGATDAASGVAGYALLFDQSASTLPAAITTTAGLTGTSAPLSDGSSYYAHLRTRDNAGNWTPTALHLGPFFIDRTAPAAPQLLTADPITWTNQNAFAVTWTNPSDLSGIAGAYYKLDAPPAGDFDGTLVSGDNLTSITNISVGSDGAHNIYVWLRDRAGNVDRTHVATTTLYYQGQAAGTPLDLTPTPDSWTNVNSFGLQWTNPSSPSGIVGAYYKLDAPPATPTDGTYVAGANIHSLSGLTVSGDGSHPVYVWLRDEAGNVNHNLRAQAVLRYDSIPPSGPTAFNSTSHATSAWSNVNLIDVRWSGASDASSGVGGYALVWDQNPNTLPAPVTTTLGLTATSPALADSMSHYAHLRTRDNAGNWTADALHLGPFFIDRTPPAPPLFLTADPITWTNHGPFALSWLNMADASGIVGAYYKLDALPQDSQDGVWVSGDNLASISNIQITGDGTHTAYVWLKDRAGNVDHASRSSANFFLDTTPPGAPSFLTPDPAGWSNTHNFSISWTNPPDASGIMGAYYKLDLPPTSNADGTFVPTLNQISGLSMPSEGPHLIYIWLKDRAGNADYRTRNSETFYYDGTPPTTTHQIISGRLGLNGWYTSSVGLSFSAQDNLSGVEETEYRINGGPWQSDSSFTLTASGVYTVEYRSVDVAGNVEPAHPLPIKIDRQPPITTSSRQGQIGAGGWYTSPVQITLNPSDAVSGVALTLYRLDGGSWQTGVTLTLNTDGSHLLEYYSRDNAGNQEDIRAETVLVDIQPPVTSYRRAGVPGAEDDWFTSSPVTVTLTPSDVASGVNTTFYRLDGAGWISGTQFIVAGEQRHTAQIYSTDRAGNSESPRSVDINIDMTPPLPPFNLAAAPYRVWTNTNAFNVTWSSQSDLSGVAGAYYKLDAEPTSNSDGTYAAGAISQLTGLAVPSEGRHTLYLWLRDHAGNASYQTRNVLSDALWFDGTPPTSTHQIANPLPPSGWYTAPVTVTISSQDALSGVGHIYWRLLSGTWTEGNTVRISTSDRHTLQYYAVDNASNIESTHSVFIRVDLDAPAAPIGLRGGPAGWQRTNAFNATWSDPIDTSGIAAAYYKLDAPPTSPRDGTLVVAPQGRLDGIQAPGEGKHTLYVWLVDNAGNVDHRRYATAIDCFWYDARPPTTTLTLAGASGIGGWYRSPVTGTLSAQDSASGVAATYYRINNGAWQSGLNVTFTTDGSYTLDYYSVDQAGNTEAIHTTIIKIDTRAPLSRITAPAGYQANPVVTVSWSGNDYDPGSGILYYDVEYRDGKTGPWTPWRTGTDETSGQFVCERGHVYYFRSRARDRAGNQEPFPPDPGDTWIYCEAIENGGFETHSLAGWTAGGELGKRVEIIDLPGGGRGYGAILGNPELGPCYDTDPPRLLVGAAVISQTVRVPAANDLVAPNLHFWYHIVTYDTVWSERYQRLYDTFDVEVSVAGSSTRTLLLRDGNPDPSTVGSGKPAVDLGWKQDDIDLSAYAGQTITLYFSINNRVDRFFNTWAFLDDVSIKGGTPLRRVFLPTLERVHGGRGAQSMQAASGPPPPR
jgi:hypothetical protein